MWRISHGRRKQKAKSGAARKRGAYHLLLRRGVPTASKSAPPEAGETPNAQKIRKFDMLKICTCHLSFATFWLHLEQMMKVGNSIELLHLEDRKFPEAFKIKIMNNDEMMKSVKMKNSRFCPKGRLEWRKAGECFAPLEWRKAGECFAPHPDHLYDVKPAVNC